MVPFHVTRPVKRTPKSDLTQSRRNRARTDNGGGPRSAKAVEIIALVEALSGDLGARNGQHLGAGLARLLADVYNRRGPTPAWVKELAAHYTDGSVS